MLSRVSIFDVVLIEKLVLDFSKGLSVFTGETGAGKSILLDSLSLAMGARAETGLIRHGAKQLCVVAEFSLSAEHEVFDFLHSHGFSFEVSESLILRRVVTLDGKSRAFVNDQSVSVSLLREIGERLIEIHGQFATHGLLNPATHLGVLDAFGNLSNFVTQCQKSFQTWQKKIAEHLQAKQDLIKAQAEEDFLRHAVEELTSFCPTKGEEQELSQRRSLMMNSEKLIEGLKNAHDALFDKNLDKSLRTANRQLESLARLIEGRFEPILESLGHVTTHLNETCVLLESECQKIDFNPHEQEQTEERLFALRAMARKYNVDPDALTDLLENFKQQLLCLDQNSGALVLLEKEEQATRLAYIDKARILSTARHNTAEKLDFSVMQELPALKLGKAIFVTNIQTVSEDQWHANGLDRVVFTASTNMGTPLAPINKIASGGELARFMLALKVNLAQKIPTLIFDEVDTGIGGATATAVGQRLWRLSQECQVLVITHSPQVASFGEVHFHVSKTEEGKTVTSVLILSDLERKEEIARMLAGAEITDASRFAAVELLQKARLL